MTTQQQQVIAMAKTTIPAPVAGKRYPGSCSADLLPNDHPRRNHDAVEWLDTTSGYSIPMSSALSLATTRQERVSPHYDNNNDDDAPSWYTADMIMPVDNRPGLSSGAAPKPLHHHRRHHHGRPSLAQPTPPPVASCISEMSCQGAGEAEAPETIWAVNVTVLSDGSVNGNHQQRNKRHKKRATVLILLLAILLVLAVVAIVVPLRRRNKESATVDASNENHKNDAWTDCFSTTQSLSLALVERTDLQSRSVVAQLCPHTRFQVGTVERDAPYRGVAPPLLTQSNLHVQCGDTGSLYDECIMASGRQSLLWHVPWRNDDPVTRNVTFQGVTFQGGYESTMELMQAGDITFRNCLFRKSSSLRSSPIHIDYRGDDEEDPRMHQTATFESCIFEDMTFYQDADATEQEDVAALINATYSSNTVVVKDCIFRRNRGRGRAVSSLIASFGASIHVENSCFYDNELHGTSSPVLLGGKCSQSSCFSGSGNSADDATRCSLVATLKSDLSVTCDVEATARECKATCQNSTIYF